MRMKMLGVFVLATLLITGLLSFNAEAVANVKFSDISSNLKLKHQIGFRHN